MKRLALCFVPIIVAPILASCDLGYAVSFKSENNSCYMVDKNGEKLGDWILGVKGTFTATIKTEEGFDENKITVTFENSAGEEAKGATYDVTTHVVTIELTEDVTIIAEAETLQPSSYN